MKCGKLVIKSHVKIKSRVGLSAEGGGLLNSRFGLPRFAHPQFAVPLLRECLAQTRDGS
jgi:hypothetical protein